MPRRVEGGGDDPRRRDRARRAREPQRGGRRRQRPLPGARDERDGVAEGPVRVPPDGVGGRTVLDSVGAPVHRAGTVLGVAHGHLAQLSLRGSGEPRRDPVEGLAPLEALAVPPRLRVPRQVRHPPHHALCDDLPVAPHRDVQQGQAVEVHRRRSLAGRRGDAVVPLLDPQLRPVRPVEAEHGLAEHRPLLGPPPADQARRVLRRSRRLPGPEHEGPPRHEADAAGRDRLQHRLERRPVGGGEELVGVEQEHEVGEEGGLAVVQQRRHPLGLGVAERVAVGDDNIPQLPRAVHGDPARLVHRGVVQDHHRVDEPGVVPYERLDDVLLVLHHREAKDAAPGGGRPRRTRVRGGSSAQTAPEPVEQRHAFPAGGGGHAAVPRDGLGRPGQGRNPRVSRAARTGGGGVGCAGKTAGP